MSDSLNLHNPNFSTPGHADKYFLKKEKTTFVFYLWRVGGKLSSGHMFCCGFLLEFCQRAKKLVANKNVIKFLHAICSIEYIDHKLNRRNGWLALCQHAKNLVAKTNCSGSFVRRFSWTDLVKEKSPFYATRHHSELSVNDF